MPLIVEDGTCPENANSYVTLAQAEAYLLPRNLWPATEAKNTEEVQEPDDSKTPEGDQTPEMGNGENKGNDDYESKEDDEEKETSKDSWASEIESDSDNTDNPDPNEPQDPAQELPDTSKPDDDPAIAKKEAALMRAFDYLNGPLVWKGNKVDWQRMPAWPRENVPIPGCNPKKPEYIASDVIPEAVCRAQMELAAFIYNGRDLFAPLERGGKVKSKSDSIKEGVDILSEGESHSVTYADDAPIEAWFPSIYPLLKPFLEEVPGEEQPKFSVHPILRG